MIVNDTLLADIKHKLTFFSSSFLSENERTRVSYFSDLQGLLLDAISSPTIPNNTRYLNAFLGADLMHSQNSAISLLRTLAEPQKPIIQRGTKTVLHFLETNAVGKTEQMHQARLMLKCWSEESKIYADLPKHFNASTTISKTNILDAISLTFNRESPQDLDWLVDNLAEKNWYDLDHDVLNHILEARLYYLLSSEAYLLLIPAFIRDLEDGLSAVTNGNFYINFLDLGNFLAYLNPVEERKLQLLNRAQKRFIGRYLSWVKQLCELIDKEAEIDDLRRNKFWFND